jgi:hypothetical protein
MLRAHTPVILSRAPHVILSRGDGEGLNDAHSVRRNQTHHSKAQALQIVRRHVNPAVRGEILRRLCGSG